MAEERSCPDGGKCHHQCGPREESCFRVAFCAPFTGYYPAEPDGRWPDAVEAAEAAVGQPSTVL